MTEYVILPGIGGSGAQHWQSLWQQKHSRMYRFSPKDWDAPDRDEWLDALDAAVSARKSPCVLVAHSLACLLIAHWSATAARKVAGALLVGVPDPRAPVFPGVAASFAAVPEIPLRFPSLIVASSNDPYGSLDYARLRAQQWGSRLVEGGPLGHINASSDLGNWDWGLNLLERFVTEITNG
ncbi:serine hydrolase family protein [Dyella solisilvae]|uniref:Serine hydrolase family protein n=1 Tax=Dyella solisilvae TaxID=1920168 RepID=A0A370K2C8_9GAMM|nr:alpha/beta hydrolase [Dyella solisilvae]RDI96799.1 serine hydrolase family protein [Dyella solisilvae]